MSEFPLESSYYDSDPSDYEPTSAQTKANLVEELRTKTHNEYLLGLVVRVDFVKPMAEPYILALMYIDEEGRDNLYGKSTIGFINKIIPSENGLEERVCYILSGSPDGTIEIERNRSMFDPDELAARMALIEERIGDGEIDEIEKLMELSAEEEAERIRAIDTARELGLNFVSQDEAEGLLRDLEHAKPFDINKLWPDE